MLKSFTYIYQNGMIDIYIYIYTTSSRDLQKNQIARLTDKHFVDFPATMARFYLNNNDISYIQDGTFKNLKKATYL